ncbi:MAG: 2-dehydro-3-deoxygalactonokinase [Isosphaeraceae bacterium]
MSDSQPTPGQAGAWVIALDGGTTNTRARLLHGHRIIATSRRGVGVRDTILGDPGQPASRLAASPSAPDSSGQPHRDRLVRAVREAVEEAARALVPATSAPADGEDAGVTGRVAFLVAAGMLSSEVGLVAVPHVPAPAGLDELARGVAIVSLPEVAAMPIYVVPGVRTPAADGPDGWFEADVMRGEECETQGAFSALVADRQIGPGRWSAFLWPGSHTKLVEVDPSGRITRSHTTLAGEFLQAASRHTILAASLPDALPDDPDPAAVAAGVRAVEREGLGRAAFLVRIAALTGSLDAPARASFWIGAAVAADVIGLAQHRILVPGRPVWVGGRQPLRALYAAELARRHRGPVVSLDDLLAESASALGACEIAARRVQFDNNPR